MLFFIIQPNELLINRCLLILLGLQLLLHGLALFNLLILDNQEEPEPFKFHLGFVICEDVFDINVLSFWALLLYFRWFLSLQVFILHIYFQYFWSIFDCWTWSSCSTHKNCVRWKQAISLLSPLFWCCHAACFPLLEWFCPH